MQAPRAVVRQIVKTQLPRRYAHHEVAQSTYNDLPLPSGSWKTQYDAQQRKYNGHLALGVATFFGSIIFGSATGMWEFHNDIPEKPAVIDSYK